MVKESVFFSMTANLALIVVDLQNDFLVRGGYYDRKERWPATGPGGAGDDDLWRRSSPQAYELRRPEAAPVVDSVVQAITRARQLGWPIAFVRATYGHAFRPSRASCARAPGVRRDYPCKPGTWGAQPIEPMLALLHPGGPQSDDEIVVHKHTLDGFAESELLSFLRARDVGSVCANGVETDACVLATAISASRTFATVVLEDCTWTSTAYGAHALRNLRECLRRRPAVVERQPGRRRAVALIEGGARRPPIPWRRPSHTPRSPVRN